MKLLSPILFFIIAVPLFSQNQEQQEIQSVIQRLFDGMRSGDSSMVSKVFAEGAILSSVFVEKDGNLIKRSSPIQGFIKAIGTPHNEIWDERIWSYDIKIDGLFAVVWTEYTFYLGENMSHCGVNVFEMMKLGQGWQISGITDTRRTSDCITNALVDINNLMDQWHKSAGVGDEKIFFNSMSDDAIYIGTDAGERWTKAELRAWSKTYFDRDTAWAFTPISRNISSNKAETIAWFDELLDTWMGTCRASGVLVREEEKWRIKHYHLSIAVPNEVVTDYLKLIKKQ